LKFSSKKEFGFNLLAIALESENVISVILIHWQFLSLFLCLRKMAIFLNVSCEIRKNVHCLSVVYNALRCPLEKDWCSYILYFDASPSVLEVSLRDV
jgi:hypothetical protein